jgi:hypothetical protein
VKTLAYFECQYIRTFGVRRSECTLESTSRKNCQGIPSLGAELWDETPECQTAMCYIKSEMIYTSITCWLDHNTPKVFKILDANPTIHGFRGTVASRSLMNAVVARFALRVKNIPPSVFHGCFRCR